MCGASVCDPCSLGRRRVSQSDDSFYRVCDFCDTKTANRGMQDLFATFIQAKKKNIEFVREAIARRIGDNERMSDRIAEVEAQLRGKDEEF